MKCSAREIQFDCFHFISLSLGIWWEKKRFKYLLLLFVVVVAAAKILSILFKRHSFKLFRFFFFSKKCGTKTNTEKIRWNWGNILAIYLMDMRVKHSCFFGGYSLVIYRWKFHQFVLLINRIMSKKIWFFLVVSFSDMKINKKYSQIVEILCKFDFIWLKIMKFH